MRQTGLNDIGNTWSVIMTCEEQIQQRLDQMPVSCRCTYKKAIKKKSMRATLNSFCLERVGYLRAEITACIDKACPLWAYRPYSFSDKAQMRRFSGAESTNAAQGVLMQGQAEFAEATGPWA